MPSQTRTAERPRSGVALRFSRPVALLVVGAPRSGPFGFCARGRAHGPHCNTASRPTVDVTAGASAACHAVAALARPRRQSCPRLLLRADSGGAAAPRAATLAATASEAAGDAPLAPASEPAAAPEEGQLLGSPLVEVLNGDR